MSKGMLGTVSLSEFRGPRDDLENKIAGLEGRMWLSAFNKFLRKENPWVIPDFIDCDADPDTSFTTWKVERHRRGGKLAVADLKNIKLVRPKYCRVTREGIASGAWIVGTEFDKQLKGKSVVNENVLRFLLKYPMCIPSEWEAAEVRLICFFGTVYRSYGRKHIWILYRNERTGVWEKDIWGLGEDRSGPVAAAIL